MIAQYEAETPSPKAATAKKSGILGAGALYTVTGLLQRTLAVVLLPFFTRWLTPSEYGQVGFLAALAGFAAYLFPLGLEAVIMHGWFNTAEEKRIRFATELQAILVVVPLALVLPIAALLKGIGAAPGTPLLMIVATLTSAAIFVMATTVPYTVLRAERRASAYLALGLLYTAAQVGVRVLLIGALGWGVEGWVLADLVGAIALLLAAPRLAGVRPKLQRPTAAAVGSLRSGLSLVPHGLGHWALALSDRLILVQAVPLSAVGTYTVGYQVGTVLLACMTELNRAVSPVYAELGSSRAAEEPGIRRLLAAQAGTVLSLGLAAALVVPVAIWVLLPPAYVDAAKVAPWAALGAVFVGLYQIPMNHLTLVRGRTSGIWFATVTACAVNVLLNLATVWHFGIVAAAVNTAVSYGLLFLLVRWAEGHWTGSHLRPDASLFRKYLVLLGSGVGAAALLLPRSEGSGQLISAIVIGVSVVAGAIGLYWRAERDWKTSGRIS